MSQAFEGIRVLDLSQVIAGPFAAMQLGLLGAEIIKLEPPGKGDQARTMMSDGPLADAGMAPIYQSVSVNKRSVCLNLKDPRSGPIMRELIAKSDVFLENFKAGVIARLGWDYDAVRAIRPDIVYCSVSGYGQNGPMAGVAAYDGAIQAASGMMSINGHPETGPTRTGYTVVDNSTGITTAYAIASALFRRARTGHGQYLDVAMMDVALTMQAPFIAGITLADREIGLLGNQSPTRLPTANVFPTRDGHLQLVVLTEAHTDRLLELIGRADLKQDPRFASRGARVENADSIRAELLPIFAADTTDGWLERLRGVGLPAAPIVDLPDALVQPQMAAREVMISLANQDGETLRLAGAGFVSPADGPRAHTPPPRLGQDTEAVLAELGHDEAAIAELRRDGVIG